jgi:hypothetical protein
MAAVGSVAIRDALAGVDKNVAVEGVSSRSITA